MHKGALPGQRQGGRERGVPNRRTILTGRILQLATEQPVSSVETILAALVRDSELPADTRLKIVDERLQKSKAKRRKVPEELRALLQIAQDTRASIKHRWKAATAMATVLLPKKPANPRWRYREGGYGFKFNVERVKEYRDLLLKRSQLESEAARIDLPPDLAKSAIKAGARYESITSQIEAIRKQLLLRPPPHDLYGADAIADDQKWLGHFNRKRVDKKPFTEAEDREEAERRARYDAYSYGPEQAAHDRRAALENQLAQILRDNRELGTRLKLPLGKSAELRALQVLFPYPSPKGDSAKSRGALQSIDTRLAIDAGQHPFQVEEPDAEGNFWSLEVADWSVEEFLDWVKAENAKRAEPLEPLTWSLVKDGVTLATSNAR